MELKKSGLLDYIEEQNGNLDREFTEELLENLVEYLEKYHGHTKNAVADRLSIIVPNLDYDETKYFVNQLEKADVER